MVVVAWFLQDNVFDMQQRSLENLIRPFLKPRPGHRFGFLAVFFCFSALCSASAMDSQLAKKISLPQALKMSLDFHPSISARKAQFQAAAGELNAARWSVLPNASFSYRGFEDNGDQEALDQEVLTVSQPIWTGGRLSGKIDFAKAQRDAAELAILEAEQKLLEETVQAFIDLYRAELKLEISTDDVKEHERLYEIINRRVAASTSPEVDLRLARARLAFSKSFLLQIQNSLDVSRARLEQFVGQPILEIKAPKVGGKERGPLGDAIRKAMSFSPAIQKMRAELIGLKAMEKVAKSSLYPQLSIGYEKNYGQILNNQDDEQVFVGLDFQPGAGLSAFSSINASQAQKAALRDNLKALELEIRRQVEVAWQKVSAAEMQLNPSKQLVKSTQKVVDSYLRQYTVGKKSWLDVLNAQRELIQARQALVDHEAMLSLSFFKMQILIGDLNRKTVASYHE